LTTSPTGTNSSRAAAAKSRAQLAFALLEPPGQHQRHGDLHQLAGLDHHPDIEPAGGALLGDAEQGGGQQQGHAQRIQRHGQLGQALRRHLGHHEQDAQPSSMLRPWSAKRLPLS
jgi:hypothetical protein